MCTFPWPALPGSAVFSRLHGRAAGAVYPFLKASVRGLGGKQEPVKRTRAERVELSTRASLSTIWPERLKAACERLLHPSVAEPRERLRQARLLAVLFAGPVLAAFAVAQAAAARGEGVLALAAALMVFGLGLLAPFLLIVTGRRRIVEPIAMALAASVLGALVAAGGGLSSPLVALAAAPAVEAGWIARTRRAVGFGVAAGGATLLLGLGLAATLLPGSAAPSPWQWAVPALYVAGLLLRMPFFDAQKDAEPQARQPVEEIIGAALLHLQAGGEVASASPQAEALFGVAPEMLYGSGLIDRIHVSDRIAYLTALADLRDGAERRSLRLRIRRPAQTGGGLLPLSLDIVARPGSQRFLAVARDDTPMAEMEGALAEAREAAERALMEKDRHLASVSHELRSPLNAILGFSDVLATGMLGPLGNDRQREYVGLIREASEHLLQVVNTVLEASKLRSGTYALAAEPFRLEEAARLCLALSAREAEAKSLALKADIAENVGVVNCDRRVVQQVLINLLSNAVKFTPRGEVKVSARRRGERLELEVSDTGIGMSAQDLARVGTPFTQVQNGYTRQGTGLGLSLVKGLVSLAGGTMSIDSAPGVGTRVHVSLPLAGAHAEGETDGEDRGTGERANTNCEWNDDALRKTA